MATAIRDMHVRGAGLIGVSAGYGMYLAALEAAERGSFDEHVSSVATQLKATRPTAVNLSWALARQLETIARGNTADEKVALARRTAEQIADDDVEHCRMIGHHGLKLIQSIASKNAGRPVNVLTHCNAGWLAFVDHGSATAPIYVALPSSSIDWKMRDGVKQIPIEQRAAEEIKRADGWLDGRHVEVHIAPERSAAANLGFDVTPRHLVTGLITERGICEANETSIFSLFPEHAP